MFILTQDKESLINVDNIAVIDIINGEDEKGADIVAADCIQNAQIRTNLLLGSYGSRRAAQTILNSIASCVESEYQISVNGNCDGGDYSKTVNLDTAGGKINTVFEMP